MHCEMLCRRSSKISPGELPAITLCGAKSGDLAAAMVTRSPLQKFHRYFAGGASWVVTRQFERRLHEVRFSAVNQSVHDLPARLEVPQLGVVVDEAEVHVEQDGDPTDRLGTLVGIGGLVVRVPAFRRVVVGSVERLEHVVSFREDAIVLGDLAAVVSAF